MVLVRLAENEKCITNKTSTCMVYVRDSVTDYALSFCLNEQKCARVRRFQLRPESGQSSAARTYVHMYKWYG